ncbi:hypothetical protein EVG20_g8289 [Dentipellis fragilis]|uniref:Uncharacterized protein n=1 Tax=Dentipellis fragilis TaxID=205917 RepID=A0A4Y9Y860_9AGAM|nr:hypothetical protein EVG20_g8289 [Dentipellis fragilis]
MAAPPRALVAKLIAVGGLLSLISFLYLYSGVPFRSRLLSSLFPSGASHSGPGSTCTPEAWADGRWNPKANYAPLTSPNTTLRAPEDVFDFNGLQGCAADREFKWHLGVDHEEQFDRFPGMTSWEWTPAKSCKGVRQLESEAFVRDLVEQGGWLVLGDSISENHFFSLSCTLFPHVRATPNYTENPYFDRAWPQNLYLNPSSPLVSTLKLPLNFSVEHTPLVTFRRVDLLLNRDELEALHRRKHPELYTDPEHPFQLFSEEQFWSLSPAEYMPLLTGQLPASRYGTLIVATAGHWTTTLLGGLRNEAAGEDAGGQTPVQRALEVDQREQARRVMAARLGGRGPETVDVVKRRVVVRAYLPGHEDCRNQHAPWQQWKPYQWKWYNWPWIGEMNGIFQKLLSGAAYPDVHYLPIDRPALLRPDAHASGDCLHIVTGTGVIEGWTQYIWHYVTRELA